ncbi:phage integrase family protein [Mycobacteroides abscessus subsp. massiliense]|uniref:hypothetical protein n=1 Tax=Mycobacteroides abscessus TaxID=36809 RepID=UPI0009CDA6EF|nr:hypothetical protein [Mycobacteroides abscessus]SKH61826.1 phage integrase family protein [Mycobacteroides abscessus subsp. massiliense]SKH81553.1 phage integrase family protein [Mycobacteroides abscessus subsp. massiliense]SKI09036.1 phage integrase family protein [Mycobacteroides abscessus subsp. massiliense]SKK13732.1 phage integrase family protein [Mycobacteroides abscessus subsp. massiliense]
MTTPSIPGEPRPISHQPHALTLVLANRRLNPAADLNTLSRFGDEVWNLSPAIFESHSEGLSVNFGRLPEAYRQDVKRYTWHLLNSDAPYRLWHSSTPRISVRTAATAFRSFSVFVLWLSSHKIDRFADVTTEHLNQYLADILASDLTVMMKAVRLVEIPRFWSYRSLLPESVQLRVPVPWNGVEPRDLVGGGGGFKSNVNRTPRIDTATIEPLLMWSLQFVEKFAPDIIDAFAEYLTMWKKSPSLRNNPVRSPSRIWREAEGEVAAYLEQLARTSGALPGRRDSDGTLTVNWSHLARLFNTKESSFKQGRSSPNEHGLLRKMVEDSGLPVSERCPLKSPIRATFGGQPWMPHPIDYTEAKAMAQRLSTACYVTIAYLSGMRPGEVLNLERGCVHHDAANNIWTIAGRKFKGARDDSGEKVPEGIVRQDPWVVVESVARAVQILETIHDNQLLFPNSLHPYRRYRAAEQQRLGQCRSLQTMTHDVEDLIAWTNANADAIGARAQRIPPDSHGTISPQRFRRTLAWHIVRRPRGLIAGAIQYGHVQVQMTLGYSGTYDSGFPDERAFEEWLMQLENLADDHQRLQDGEHVSGPAAQTYVQRINAAHSKFAGRVLTNMRQARDLLGNPLLQVFPGRAMTCVFDQSKALCQTRSIEDDPRRTPDQDDCRRNCTNIAYTDRDIDVLSVEREALQGLLIESLAPSPRTKRLQSEIDRIGAILESHAQEANSHE